MSKSWELRQALRDKAMRKALLEFLQKATAEEHNKPWSDIEPIRDDEEVIEELHRVLKVRKGWFK